MRTSIEGTIDRVEDGVAVAKFENGGELFLPLNKLELDVREGQLISVAITGGGKNPNDDQAKDFLSEILEP